MKKSSVGSSRPLNSQEALNLTTPPTHTSRHGSKICKQFKPAQLHFGSRAALPSFGSLARDFRRKEKLWKTDSIDAKKNTNTEVILVKQQQ